jgi:hypothetical protein
MGLAMGSMAGAGAANASSYTMQCRYHMGYEQCMYVKGHRVPALERYVAPTHHASAYSPPPPLDMPPTPDAASSPGAMATQPQ